MFAAGFPLLLPVESITRHLINALSQGNSILVAPPGAGKSTCLPLKLLQAAQFRQQKIIMLQPRRVVVRSIASYLAKQLAEPVGQTIGYRIRGEQKVSPNTRLEIVTEGLLTRMLQSDPELKGIGLIIFDEFHERSLHADFSLALSIETQQGLRDDLRLLVMSATLDAAEISKVLPNAAIIESEGRSYPIEVHYRPIKQNLRLDESVARLIREVILSHQGNVLVFLPGSGNIRNLEALLQDLASASLDLCPLYGDLDKKQQMQAVAPTAEGRRKIVLATNIAETSLTIEGISVVIDSGQEKVAVFHLAKGITQLKQQQISQASATQRAGRAGRLGPGICYRMWPQESQQRMARQATPQILQADMAPMMLQAAIWGSELTSLPLLDYPSEPQLSQAKSLLQGLGAMDKQGAVTRHGRRIGSLGTNPRLANMLLKASELSPAIQTLACVLAAVLETAAKSSHESVEIEKQIAKLIRQPGHPAWQIAKQWGRRLKLSIDPKKIKQIKQDSHDSERYYKDSHGFDGYGIDDVSDELALLVAMAFPDRLAKCRGDGRYILSGGVGAMLDLADPLSDVPWLAVAELMLGKQADARVTLAQPISLALIEKHFSHLIEHKDVCEWDKEKKLVGRNQRRLGAILIESKAFAIKDPAEVVALWCQEIRRAGIDALPIDKSTQGFMQRVRLAASLYPEHNWPDFSHAWLLDNLSDWLGPYLSELRRWNELHKLDWMAIVTAQLDWAKQQALQQLFPARMTVPSGNSHALIYHTDGSVTLAVKMTEMYGLAASPRLAQGKLPVTVELLSPAMRPIQKTQDLAGFWSGSYIEVQKEMKGRYPKHFWPDDPANAVATTKTKRHMEK